MSQYYKPLYMYSLCKKEKKKNKKGIDKALQKLIEESSKAMILIPAFFTFSKGSLNSDKKPALISAAITLYVLQLNSPTIL
eukprot:c5921_g1_i1 orf=204-446(-)